MNSAYTLRFHPKVRSDLETIARLIAEYAGRAAAERILAEIEAAVRTLADTPHRGSIRDDIAPGLRAIPAGRRAVVAFRVDDLGRQVLVYSITYGGADWIGRVSERR